ncbi:hypothetical protein ACOMHN_060360 [Nucella lapillus]
MLETDPKPSVRASCEETWAVVLGCDGPSSSVAMKPKCSIKIVGPEDRRLQEIGRQPAGHQPAHVLAEHSRCPKVAQMTSLGLS